MITIVDYGMCNLGSIRNMFKRIGVETTTTADVEEIRKATKLILPGIGAFDQAMQKLDELGLIPALTAKVVQEQTPVLGICLGMQILTKGSEEGQRAGLGWIDAETVRFRFPDDPQRKIPHMGWATVAIAKQTPLVANLPPEPRYYFVHSYYVRCHNTADILLTAEYGTAFTAAFHHHNIMGVQFHPEKSHRYGVSILSNFSSL